MSPENNSHNQDPRDHHLDAAIREVIARTGADDSEIEPEAILAYLDGTAADDQITRVRTMLARSPVLRRELLDIAVDLEKLSSPEVDEAFAAHPAPETPAYSTFMGAEQTEPDVWSAAAEDGFEKRRESTFDRGLSTIREAIRDFFTLRQPAYAYVAAYTITFALMAYPTYRYFTAPTVPSDSGTLVTSSGVVVSTRSLSLHPDLGIRGGEETPPVQLDLAQEGPILDLTLHTPNQLSSSQRIQVTLEDTGGVLWEDADYQGFSADDPHSLRILLNAQELKTGMIDIHVTRFHRTTSARILTEDFRIQIK